MNETVYKRNRTFFGSPYRITHEEEQNPVSVFHSFFDFLHLYQVREVMEELKEAIMLSSKTYSPEERVDAVYVLTRLEEFVEAGFVIARKDIEGGKKDQEPNNEKEAYDFTMRAIEMLMKRGEEDLSQKELNLLRTLSEAMARYEDVHEALVLPNNAAVIMLE